MIDVWVSVVLLRLDALVALALALVRRVGFMPG
jgi:hypothetical protein